jgi:PTS system N-acetylgalactosamine-specific IIA component
MTSSETPRAVLAGHGDFAAGLASAVAQITGVSDAFTLLSNRAMSGEEILVALRAALDAHALRVIFTDLPAGSCTLAARRLQRERPDLVLITGVNLATLLDFVFSDVAPHDGDAEDTDVTRRCAIHAVEKGRSALAISGAPASSTIPGARGGS